METHNIMTKWTPGHMGIEGNEIADRFADKGALRPQWDAGLPSQPTVSSIRSIFRQFRKEARIDWWVRRNTKLSKWYKRWGLTYEVKSLKELELPRNTLHRLLAIRFSHGDFTWYHRKFAHVDANLQCTCGRSKSLLHIVHCCKTVRQFDKWPKKPLFLPTI